MFFWKKQSPEEKRRQERQNASIEALVRGDIPLSARERLEEQARQPGDFFSSDLTCREFLFARQAGYEPIAQVMGSAFVNISFFGGIRSARRTGEVDAVSKAQLSARSLALSRMQQEAAILKADGIIGVRLIMRNYDWSQRQVEFTAIGTAIRLPGVGLSKSADDLPFTCALSGQEFWQLHQAGYLPRGICLGVCSYYVFTDAATQKVLYNWWGTNNANNAEVPSYTQGFYNARERAMNRLIADIAAHEAEGVVGVKVDQDVEDIEYEINDRTYHDFLIHFNLMGTSVVQNRQLEPKAKHATLVMMDLSSKKTRALKFMNDSSNALLSASAADQDDNDDDDDEELS